LAHRKNSIPDTEALGLDVDALVGLKSDEIRSLLAAHAGVALIVGHEPVPAGWPEEIATRDEAEDSLVWSYRDADGAWQEIYVLGTARREPTDPIPAHVYTRRPLDPAEASIRPIVQLVFRPDGVCKLASAGTAEDRMILAVKETRRLRRPQPKDPKRLRRLSAFSQGSPIEDLEALMGLPRPEFAVDAEDFITESDGRLVIGVAPSEQPVFFVYDGGRNSRLVAFVEPGQPPKLLIRTDEVGWPPIEIRPDGIRVLPRCGMESDETALDFYAPREAGHRVVDPSGAPRPILILMVAGPCYSSVVPDAQFVARIVALASPEAHATASREPGPRDLVVQPDGQIAEVRDSSGKVVVAMRTTIRAESAAYFVDGVVTRG